MSLSNQVLDVLGIADDVDGRPEALGVGVIGELAGREAPGLGAFDLDEGEEAAGEHDEAVGEPFGRRGELITAPAEAEDFPAEATFDGGFSG